MPDYASVTQSTWFWPLVIGVLAVLATIPITLAATRWSARRRKLLYWIAAQSNVVSGVESKITGLELRFRGESVSSASIARVVVWNEGTEAISEDALETDDPLRLILPKGVRILDTTVVHRSKGSGEVSVTPDSSASSEVVGIRFRYLNAESGFVVQLVHTGTLDQVPALQGTLKDLPPPKSARPNKWWFDHSVILLLPMLAATGVAILTDPFPRTSEASQLFLFGVFGFVGLGFPFAVLKGFPLARFRPPGTLKPYVVPPLWVPGKR